MKKYLFVIITTLLIAGCNSSDKDMPVNIGLNANSITVINSDAKTFTNVRLKINNTYHYKLSRLQGKEQLQISLTDFADKQGNRFSPIVSKVQDIYIAGEFLGDKYWASFKPKQ